MSGFSMACGFFTFVTALFFWGMLLDSFDMLAPPLPDVVFEVPDVSLPGIEPDDEFGDISDAPDDLHDSDPPEVVLEELFGVLVTPVL